MRIIVAGGREFNDYSVVERELDAFLASRNETSVEIVSGGCRGTDMLGVRYAKEHEIPFANFPADWNLHGKAAGPIRNATMAEYAAQDNGVLYAFWDGKSRGTKSMIREAKKNNLEIRICYI